MTDLALPLAVLWVEAEAVAWALVPDTAQAHIQAMAQAAMAEVPVAVEVAVLLMMAGYTAEALPMVASMVQASMVEPYMVVGFGKQAAAQYSVAGAGTAAVAAG
jgi:hypothetical protein